MPHAAYQHGASKRWTTRQLLAWMGEAFTNAGLDSPRLSAEMLVAHVVGCDRLKLYTDADRPASPLERDQLRDLTARALKHEPIQYLVGEAWFYGLPFRVDPRVLIPRPATESAVEHVLHHAKTHPEFAHANGEGVLFADVCTGSGCIVVSLLKNLPEARAVATDLSTDAIEVAQANAERHGVSDRLDLIAGDLLEPVLEHPAAGARAALHYLVANPPYIPDAEWDDVGPNVKDHEPTQALRGGADGLALLQPLIAHGPALVRNGGLLLLESAASTAETVAEKLREIDRVERVDVLSDFEGLPRVVVARVG